MPRNENEINDQKFSGVMDPGSDLTVTKEGNHKASYGFRAITSKNNTFIFESINGTSLKGSIKEGYKPCCWEVYENSIYILSKKFEQTIFFEYADDNSGKIVLIFSQAVAQNFEIGDWIYVEFGSQSPYKHIERSGAFQIESFPDQASIKIDIDSSLFFSDELGIGTDSGIIEPLNGGEIGEMRVDFSNGDIEYTPLYHHKDLLFSFKRYGSKESTHINKENGKKLRWYFTDYLTEPKVFNLRADIYKTVISSGSLINDKRYMVLEGQITYDGTVYGPDQSDGNIFTASGGILTYTGTGRVIEYYPVELLDWNPDFNQGDLQLKTILWGGNVSVGTYSAIYRCIDEEGAITPWSLPTNPIYLGKGSNFPSIFNYHEQQGALEGENSGKRMVFTITNLDTRWTRVQVAIIKHTSKLTFDNPLVFYDEPFIESKIDVEFTGENSEYSFNLAEITSFRRWFKKVMSIESMQEIAFAGNFESGSLLSEFDPEKPEIGYVIKELVSDEVQSNDYVDDNGNHIWNVENGAPYNINEEYPFPLTGHSNFNAQGLYSGTYYILEGGDATIGASSAVSYFDREIFTVDDSQVQTIQTITDDAEITPIILIKAHQDIPNITSTDDMIVGEVYEVVGGALENYSAGRMFKYIGQTLNFGLGVSVTHKGYKAYKNNGYLDGNGELVQNKLMTYPRNEKIRVGVVPVDKKGTKLPVRWLGDYTTPTIQDEELSSGGIKTSRSSKYVASLRHMGLTIGTEENPFDISDIIDKISGFYFVIAPIKRRTKVQGLMFQTQRQLTDPIGIAPEFWTYLDVDAYYENVTFPTSYVHGFPTFKVLFSPDILFQTEEDLGIELGDQIKIESYLDDGQWEILENATSWPQLKGNFFYQDVQGSRFDSTFAYFFKYQELAPDQETNRTNPGSTVTIETSKKYRFETTGEVPGEPGWRYRLFTYSEDTLLTPVDISVYKYSSYIYNHLLIKHDFRDTFGPEDGAIRNGVLASIVSSEEAVYGNTENQQYVSVGHFQPINEYIKEKTGGQFYDVEIFGGQTFLSFFTQLRNTPRKVFGDAVDGEQEFPGLGLSITFPCESRVNPYRRIFDHIARDRDNLIANLQPESYEVNNEVKYLGDLIKYNALQDFEFENTLFEKSVAYSLTKINGEEFDSFRQFPFANVKPTEGDMERILAIKQSDQYLIVWHEKGVSYFPINDRATISDNQGGNIRIGYGGIMEVNIPLSFIHGIQDRSSLVETETHFVWVSKRNKNIVAMKKGGKPTTMNQENVLDAFIEDVLSDDSDILLNDDPYFTHGIVGAYDPYHKEILFSFINGDKLKRSEIYTDRNNFKTLVISSKTLQATGYFPFVVDIFIVLNRFIFSSCPIPSIAVADAFANVDEVYYWEGKIYRCNTAVAIPNPASGIAAAEEFDEIASFEDFFLHYDGAHMNFFGVETKPEFHAVFNQPLKLFKRYDAHQLRTNQNPETVSWYTDVIDEVPEESASFDNRDYSSVGSLQLTPEGGRPRGHGIVIVYKWANTASKVLLRQIDLFFKFINQK